MITPATTRSYYLYLLLFNRYGSILAQCEHIAGNEVALGTGTFQCSAN